MQAINLASSLFGTIGGLALFMYAMTVLRGTLGKVSGARVTKILEKVSNNPVKGMAAGTVATVMTQSSSITVLTLIGFVNAGLMTFRQSLNVMLGSEIGTTVVAQMVSFKIGEFFWPLIFIGFFLHMFARSERFKLVGEMVFSFGLVFFAMYLMTQSAEKLMLDPLFPNIMMMVGTNPIIGVLVGTLIAGITQSSAATAGLVIAFGSAGLIDLPTAIALILGANIGTCFLELAAAVGATSPAKRTALAQTLINVIGVSVVLPFIGPFTGVVALTDVDISRQIANAHTLFNVTVSFALIPLVGGLATLCERLVPDKEGEVVGRHLFDEDMLYYPQAALIEAERELVLTAERALEMIQSSRAALLGPDMEAARRTLHLEDIVDGSRRETEKFIDKIREDRLNEKSVEWRLRLLSMLVDIERVGDLAVNIAEFALEKENSGIIFSQAGATELQRLFMLVEETYATAVESVKVKSRDKAKEAERLEDQVDLMERELKAGHLARMEAGICMPEADTVFVETVRCLERISDHADNMACDLLAGYQA